MMLLRKRRRPGRPRSARADRDILEATVQILVEEGYQALTIEGIAERAGVGKTTIYRRFSTVEEIIVRAFGALDLHVDVPDTGSTREDLLQLGHAFRVQASAAVMFPVMGQIVGTALSNPAVLDAFREHLMKPRQATIRKILERGVERGDVRPDIDIELIADLIPGGIIFYKLFQLPPDADLPEDYPDRVLNTIWHGIKAE
ncbi:MAG: TetR/AcrR family transcriptional regulator [Thermomicrobiales bacterium]